MTPSKYEIAKAAARMVVDMRGQLGWKQVQELLDGIEGKPLPSDVAPQGSDLAEFAEEFMIPDETTLIRLVRAKDTGVAQCYLAVHFDGRTALINVVHAKSHLSVDVRGFLDGQEGTVHLRGFGASDGSHDHFVPGTFGMGTVMVGKK